MTLNIRPRNYIAMKHEIKILNGLRTMRPSNKTEAILYDKLIADGWAVTKSGYPDFFCVKDEKVVLIEVKPKSTHGLKTNQQRILELLSTYSVPCYKWTPDGKFEKITKE